MAPAQRRKTVGTPDTEKHEDEDLGSPQERDLIATSKSRNAFEARGSSQYAVSSPHRPLTRSQTGSTAKRPRPDDAALPKTKNLAIKAEESPKITTEPLMDGSSINLLAKRTGASSSSYETREGTHPRVGGILILNLSPSSTANADTNDYEPRSLSTLPLPVPNVTKKSRGRRVPIRFPNEGSGTGPQDTRIYVCKVESCGKCFHRGEHLKRHIRSIHTHEKPFKCTFPLCQKHFNRRDNLLQHLKVHKDLTTSEPINADDPGSPNDPLRRTSPPLLAPPSPQAQSNYIKTHDAYAAPFKQTRMAPMYRVPVTSYNSYSSPYTSLLEPVSITTNIAVSSLRTQIPHSPPASRSHFERTI